MIIIKNLDENPTDSLLTTSVYLTGKQNLRIAIEFEDFIADQLHRPDLASEKSQNSSIYY